MSNKEFIKIIEVGPRDGLQNEKQAIATEDKIKYIQMLIDSGLSWLEASSFVRPDSIPQLSDGLKVADHFKNVKEPMLWYLTPNIRGFDNGVSENAECFALFTATSNSFCKKNINCTVDESLKRFEEVFDKLQPHHNVRGYISTVFGCPYEGFVGHDKTLELIEYFVKKDVFEISLGDTIGVGTPRMVEELVTSINNNFDSSKIAMHFHDTRGMALANILKSIEMGIRLFDSSSGGLGGCPYAKGAAGNVATEDVLYLVHDLGFETGVDEEKILRASHFILNKIGKTSPSKYVIQRFKELGLG